MKPSSRILFFTKLTQWEFWPFSVVYFPIFLYYFWLSLKARSFFFFSASNPGIETGGMLGESKWSILKNIPEHYRAFTLFIPKNTPFDEVKKKLLEIQLAYPIIAKPDVGERGTSVEKITSEKALENYCLQSNQDFLIQEYIDYPVELGVFYYRMPDESKGVVSSIVQKDFLKVTGDGQTPLGSLIANYPRAAFQYERLKKQLNYEFILDKDETLLLEPIGNHCRGTTFLDANHQIDEVLRNQFDTISKQIPGFYFGRYDLRCASFEALKNGIHLKIVELNGAGAEPGHIYQPGFSLWKAWGVLLHHWKMLYSISKLNHKNGVPYMQYREAKEKYREIQEYRKKNR